MGPRAFSAQPMCGPQDWCYCTPRCPTRKNQYSEVIKLDESYEQQEPSYRDYQAQLRAAGWDAYNSDYVDEFPTW